MRDFGGGDKSRCGAASALLLLPNAVGVGVGVEFWELVAYWVVKVVFFTLICFFLGWLGLRVLDVLTPRIHERELMGK
ncbi:MAG: hypothetical protein OEX16_03800, partial [Hadesarchaea archaeon]|nr:hypothetical protein [Hadesarchaea archaeon]